MADPRLVNLEVVVQPDENHQSMFDPDAVPLMSNLDIFRSHKGRRAAAARKLANNGFNVDHIGEFSISASCDEGKFESFLGAKISERKPAKAAKVDPDYSMRSPAKGSSQSTSLTVLSQGYV